MGYDTLSGIPATGSEVDDITINDDGYIYFGDDKEIYIKHQSSDDALFLTGVSQNPILKFRNTDLSSAYDKKIQKTTTGIMFLDRWSLDNIGLIGHLYDIPIGTDTATKKVIMKPHGVEVANFEETAGTTLSKPLNMGANTLIDINGYVTPISNADASAPNNSVYYSTTASRLVYKDGAGAVNNLY